MENVKDILLTCTRELFQMYKLANIYQIFKLNRDVRQGEHLSPFSFSHFINDLEDCLTKSLTQYYFIRVKCIVTFC